MAQMGTNTQIQPVWHEFSHRDRLASEAIMQQVNEQHSQASWEVVATKMKGQLQSYTRDKQP